MRFSRFLKSSPHSLPSPDGAYIATVLPSYLSIRATRSLQIVREINLPADTSASTTTFLWSPSSKRLIVSSLSTIRVFSIKNQRFSATINHPTSGTTRATHIAFGATDNEVLVFSEFGLKLTVFNLATSTAIEIPSPKFYSAAAAPKGYAIRQSRDQWALLTRNAGKDIISIHAAGTAQIIRSWAADSIDAQSIYYSPDGRWLAVCETAAQGHKILFYAADGNLFRTWRGPAVVDDKDSDWMMGPGVRLFDWNGSGDMIAVADYSPNISILSSPSFSEIMRLSHPATIKPAEGLHIWQEHLNPGTEGGFERSYTLHQQTLSPPTVTPASQAKDTLPPNGINLMSFDRSGTLLATRAENMPTTLWIWDLRSRQLRAVLLQHSPILRISWHPEFSELLFIRSEGDENHGLVHLWEPSWEMPRIVDFTKQMVGSKLMGRTLVRWLGSRKENENNADNAESYLPTIFFSDSQDYVLAAIPENGDVEGDEGDGKVPWEGEPPDDLEQDDESAEDSVDNTTISDSYVPENERIQKLVAEGESLARMSGSSQGLEDTFHFRKFVS